MRSLRTSPPTRARRVPCGVSIDCTSTSDNLVLRSVLTPPTLALPYIGWNPPPPQPAVKAASVSAQSRRAVRSDDHIHDPLRDDDDLFRAFPVERLFYRIEGQNGSLHGFFSRVARHG